MIHAPTSQLLKSIYKILKQIGEGSFGIVFEALDTKRKRKVAIKQFAPNQLADNPQALERFRRESIAIAQLNHPHVVAFIEDFQEAGIFYQVMAYCTGGNLAEYVQKHASLPIQAIITIGLSLADALHELHSRGIIHRDIKPANVFLNKTTHGLVVQLGDFGVAYVPGETPLTKSGQMIGTPLYLSPEQINKQPATSASDVYGLGVVLYELVIGQHYLAGKGNLSQAIAKEKPQPLTSLRPEIPLWLSELVLSMLEKSPQNRPTAKQVYEVLLKQTGGSQSQFESIRYISEEPELSLGQFMAFLVVTSVVTAGLVWGSYSGQLSFLQWPTDLETSPAVTTTTESPPVIASVQGVNEAGGLKLRATPSTEGEILQYLPDGTLVSILETRPEDKWVLVESDGLQGWVYGDYLEE